METRLRTRGSTIREWLEMLGVPVFIFALLFALMVGMIYDFVTPPSGQATISSGLEKSPADLSAPRPPQERQASHS